MSLPIFNIHEPQTVADAIEFMSEYRGSYTIMAGGTDVLPAYAQQINVHQHIISLSGIPSLTHLSETSIGACVTLSELIRNKKMLPPVLVQAAKSIAGPAIRSSATVGGNLLLSGRCRFFNQSTLSRSAHGPCMKAGGTGCLVVVQDKSCYAISSGDLVPVLLALGANFRLIGPEGERIVPASDFFLPDGIQANILRSSELLTEIILPDDVSDLTAGYIKLGSRSAIDFPEAGVAVAVKQVTDGTHRGVSEVEYLRVAFGALGPAPVVFTFSGEELKNASVEDLIKQIWKKLSPDIYTVRNGSFRPGYRKAMAKKYLGELLDGLISPFLPPQKSSTEQNGISA